jgi:cell division protein FtsB
MASKSGYVFEHRLIMARQLGRCLHPWELVHHKNHIRDDNRLENLQLVSDDRHKQITAMENRLNQLLAENKRLEKEISNLKGRRNEQ